MLGIEVFGREPDYDTNLDPVVRTTAAEIRKRLAQYYQEPNHESELRIELPLGSYAARFHTAAVRAAAAPASFPTEIVREPVELPVALPSPSPALRLRRTLQIAAIAAVAIAVVGGMYFRTSSKIPHSALDRLWGPILESPSPVLLCVGQRSFVGASATEPQAAIRAPQ